MNNYFKNTVTIKTERWKSKLANSFSFFALWLTFLWFHPFPLIGFSFRSFFCVSCHRKYLYTRLCQNKKKNTENLIFNRYDTIPPTRTRFPPVFSLSPFIGCVLHLFVFTLFLWEREFGKQSASPSPHKKKNPEP